MKKRWRLLSLLLSICLVLSSMAILASCDGKEETTSVASGGDETTEAKEEVHPEIGKKNYDDEFYLHILPDVNPVGYYWVEESKNDIMSDAVYSRQEKVRQHIGVEIVGTATGNFSEYIEPFKTAVKNKDGSVDTLISHVHTGIDGLVGENYLTDFNDVPGVELSADYWNQEFMEDISLNDHMYLGFNNFNILYTYVVAFNKGMLDKYDDSFEESVYDMVNNYHWTLDKMISIASLVYIDKSNDGKTADDTFGISAYHWVPFCGFLHSSNINLVEVDSQGYYKVSVYNDVNREKTVALIDKIKALTLTDYAWFKGSSETISLGSNRVLFNLTATISLTSLLDSDVEFGVLPYPMWDESQKDVGYRSLQWGGYLCIPSYTRDIQMIGETIELLAFYSDDVADAYYQKLLGKQVADSPQDKQMLELIWDSVCSDFGQTYYSVVVDTSLLYMVPILTKEDTTQNIASFMAKVDKMADKKFKQFINKTK